MKPKDRDLRASLEKSLEDFARKEVTLPGIEEPDHKAAFVEQLIESVHRVRYVGVVSRRSISDLRADPSSDLFDPLKAAIVKIRMGDLEEAAWLVFLFVHFGKHRRGGWRYAREVYAGDPDKGLRWDWVTVKANPSGFRAWLEQNQERLKRNGSGFGNHRKRESLDARSANGTGAVVESYVAWVERHGGHGTLIGDAIQKSKTPPEAFDRLYQSMGDVRRFGRTARFDYLTMLGKLGIADIRPGSPYLKGSTGPLAGARRLIQPVGGPTMTAEQLDGLVIRLAKVLDVGMQVLEDALCNWNKSPGRFKPFRG